MRGQRQHATWNPSYAFAFHSQSPRKSAHIHPAVTPSRAPRNLLKTIRVGTRHPAVKMRVRGHQPTPLILQKCAVFVTQEFILSKLIFSKESE